MKHILIADDEPLIRKGLLTMLEQYPIEFASIRTADSGMKALNLIKASAPDILFTDIRMPKMNGLDLCKKVYELFPHVQIVVISGYGDFEYAQKCMSYGVKEYLLKPFTPSSIHELLDKIMVQTRSAFSLSKYEEWMDHIVDAVWTLQREEALALLDQWGVYSRQASLSDTNFVQLLNDCLLMIQKRLSARNFRCSIQSMAQNGSPAQLFAEFQGQIIRMMDELALQRGGQDIMQQAKAYIDENITQDLSIESLADYLGITPPYFSHLFKKVYNETFVRYRILKRMEIAKRLLEIPHYRTTDIAYEVGYENYPHFSKTFKKVTGLSPQEYRHTIGIK